MPIQNLKGYILQCRAGVSKAEMGKGLEIHSSPKPWAETHPQMSITGGGKLKQVLFWGKIEITERKGHKSYV